MCKILILENLQIKRRVLMNFYFYIFKTKCSFQVLHDLIHIFFILERKTQDKIAMECINNDRTIHNQSEIFAIIM